MTHIDWRGTEIKVGSVVLYPSRQSSSVWVNEGVVESVTEEPHPYAGRGRWADDATVLKIGVRRTRSSTRWNDKPGSRVSYPDPDRITVIG